MTSHSTDNGSGFAPGTSTTAVGTAACGAGPAERPYAPVGALHIHQASAAQARAWVPGLADILCDCVDGGASVSFMAPLKHARASAFWAEVADGVARGERLLLVALDATGTPWGTVQLVLAQPENQPHRADVAKMLVHRQARRQGLAARLMAAVDDAARAAGKRVLVLDTVTGGDAERLYQRAGWLQVGVIPDYALFPHGGLCATTVFTRQLALAPG